VWGALITVFMVGLAIGYLAGGRWSQNNPTLSRLGVLLLVGAITSVPVPIYSVPLLDEIAIAMPDPRFGSLLGATALFLTPTVFSGMISPYCVRLLVQATATSGRHAGQLYFVSTFGSAAGTLLTSFYLVLWFEVNQILYALIAVSILLGIASGVTGVRRRPRTA